MIDRTGLVGLRHWVQFPEGERGERIEKRWGMGRNKMRREKRENLMCLSVLNANKNQTRFLGPQQSL